MKKVFPTGIICMFFTLTVFSQEFAPIVVQKKGMKRLYMQNDLVLKRKELHQILTNSPASSKEIKIANVNTLIGGSLMGLGCLVIGASSLASTLKDVNALNSGSGDFSDLNDNTVFYIGCGMALAGIPFALIGNSHFVKSIVLYNSQNTTGQLSIVKLDVGITSNGVGLKFQF